MAIKLKLLIDKEKNRVVLAESDKYFVDTLFSFLTIPIGAVVRLSGKKSNLGCMDALHESIENLDSQYLQTEAVKEMLLRPRSAWEDRTKDLALNVDTELPKHYLCELPCIQRSTNPSVSTVKNVRCHCGQPMNFEITKMDIEIINESNLVGDGIKEGVFVKGILTFMIGDDLWVSPISTTTFLSLLDKLGVRDRAALEEKSVDVGADEAFHILRRLLVSNTPLTDVFLPKPKAVDDAFDALKLSPEVIATDKKHNGKKMNLKLLISKSKNKVLYAEAAYDFLDLLFSFLTFPLSSIVKLLGPGSSIRCLDNLYKSVEDLSGDDDLIILEECRAMLLDPKLSLHSGCDNQLLPIMEGGPKTFLTSCHFINPKLSDASTECGGGFVKGPKTRYMVTDGLDVKPLSVISGICILDRFDVPIGDIQERVVRPNSPPSLTMSISNLSMWAPSKPSTLSPSATAASDSLSSRSVLVPFRLPSAHPVGPTSSPRQSSAGPIHCSLRELRERIDSVKNTQKITEAMKLVAAAKVRRAQEAVVNGRPFSETLVEVLYNINEQLQTEDVDVPLTKIRPVKKIALVVVTGDRGLCGGFNNFVIKKAEARIQELKDLGVAYTIISVGKKGNSYFLRRPYIPVDKFLEGGTLPTTKEAQAIADDVFSLFISEEVDKVELLYTKFVSLVKSDPVIHTLLPLSPKGEICDINGNCVDAAEDELFRLTTKEGKFTIERDAVRTPTPEFSPILQFEQDPVQILDALLPLYLNSQILRALQESLASELAARMTAMSNASDNASDLKKSLSMVYNRRRQAKITGEILEIVAGANALT